MEITWHIAKITSDRCVETIAKSLLIVDDIVDITVDPSAKTVSFTAQGNQAAQSARRALEQAGYPPEETE